MELVEEIVDEILADGHLNEVFLVIHHAGEICKIRLCVWGDITLQGNAEGQLQIGRFLAPWGFCKSHVQTKLGVRNRDSIRDPENQLIDDWNEFFN
jgi:hypothetical protein